MTNFHENSALVMVPAFNAGEYLTELINRLRQFVCDSNLLVVDDGSTDNSAEILKVLDVNRITFAVNRGKGAALSTGFEYAIRNGYRSIVTIDADLQHLPEDLPGFFALDNGHRVVVGTRTIKLDRMPFPRWLTNNMSSLIISVFSSSRVRDSQSGYRLIPISLLKTLDLRTTGYDLESEILFKAGLAGCSVHEVPISTIYEGSQSYINPFADSWRFIRLIWRRIWA
ncbi:MAG: glycosyltransferase family 2 protein [bacterium]|nr:glycosyltransferase family 2 protein [bacterium]